VSLNQHLVVLEVLSLKFCLSSCYVTII
jgi:hypothetical protein